MGFFADISPIFKKREITFIKRYKETAGVYTFDFEKPVGLNWKAGQHGVFTILHKKVKKSTRPFSVASAPSENVIKLSMGISDTPSEFKKAMLELRPGMKISMRGPIGPLYIDHPNPSLLIAGGIGITPFRSILKEVESEGKESRKQLHLLYVDSKELHLYRDEFDEIAQYPSITVHFLNSREELYQGIDTFITQHENSGMYYVGGAKSMVDSVSTYLRNNGIPNSKIRKDIFIGI